MIISDKVGHGHYGCVVFPDIVSNNSNKVSKLFFNEDEFNDETHNYENLIRPYDKYDIFVPSIESFELTESKTLFQVKYKFDGFEKCESIKGFNMFHYGINVHEIGRTDMKLELRHIWDSIETLGKGIDFLHSNRIVHGDIKPANVLLKDNRFRIVDYGLTHSFLDRFSRYDIGLMREEYPFFPCEYSLISYVYIILKRNKLLDCVSNEKNKNEFLSILENYDDILPDICLRNRDDRHMPISSDEEEASMAERYVDEFVNYIVGFNQENTTMNDMLFNYFKDIQHLVDVHGFGTFLFRLSDRLPKLERRRVLEIAKRLTCLKPNERHRNWREFMRKAHAS